MTSSPDKYDPAADVHRYRRWAWDYDDYTLSQCVDCSWWRPGVPGRCAAFPDGVPMAILTNEHDHRDPYPGDHGIRFRRRPAPPEGVSRTSDAKAADGEDTESGY